MDEHIPLFLPERVYEEIEKAKQGADDSDHRFIASLLEGYKWQFYVLNAIQSYGYWGTIHPLYIRPDFEQRSDFSDAFDILVGPHPHSGNGATWVHSLDVKARTRLFNSPADFPFPSIIIEPHSRFKARKDILPDFWAHVSQFSGGIIFVSKESVSDWDIENKKGRDYITAPKKHFLSIDQYIEQLPTKPLVLR